MGVHESHESATQVLASLQAIPDDKVTEAMQTLVNKTKYELQMQVSKWELLSLLGIKSNQVKSLLLMLTAKSESVSCHQLMVCLVLSRKLPVETQLKQVLESVCFQIEPGQV